METTRRGFVTALAISSVISAIAGCLGTETFGEGTATRTEAVDNLADADDLDIYLDGLDVDVSSLVESLRAADLAVLAAGTSQPHDEVVDAVNDGTTVAVVGDDSIRSLVGMLRDDPANGIDPAPGQSSILGDGFEYSFGYELPEAPASGVALAYPAVDGTLELHSRSGEYRSDRQALNSAVGEYRSAAARPSDATLPSKGGDEDWHRQGRVSTTTQDCPWGTMVSVVDCYVLPGDDRLVLWRFQDEMRPSANRIARCAGDQQSVNGRSFRRMSYGSEHGGDLLWFDPTTLSASSDVATVDLEFVRGDWSYDVPGVTVSATENHIEDAIRWVHEVGRDSPVADELFVSEPGVVVEYSPTTRVATTGWDVAFDYVVDGEDDVYTVERSGEGAWSLE